MPLTPFIAGRAGHSYGGGMPGLILRLAAITALLLMSFGMTGMPAAAQPAADPVPESHCAGHDQPAQDLPPMDTSMHCMACAALPASFARSEAEALLPRMAVRASAADEFHGTPPEIATPPPKCA